MKAEDVMELATGPDATATSPRELRTPFFEGMSDAERKFILQHAKHRHFAEGSVIAAGGDDRRELCIIESGMVVVSAAGPDGKARMVHRLGPGSIVGELSFFTGHRGFNTVRAGTDVDLFVLSEARFRYVAAQVPRLYLNIGAIMAQKLADIDEAPTQQDVQIAAVLVDHGAPPLTSYALAASLAWHVRHPILLLVIAEEGSDAGRRGAPWASSGAPFAELPGVARHDHSAMELEPRAYVAVVEIDRASSAACEAAIARYASRYHHIVVQVPAGWPPLPLDVGIICLDGGLPSAAPKWGLYTIRGNSPHGASRPDHRGVLCVPELTASERAELSQGLLSTTGATGRALGWAARDLAKLKVGVALGAGGSKGFGHFGVIDTLVRAGLPIDYIGGTSVGSCVAALYAIGFNMEDMTRILDEVGVAAWSPTVPRSSFLSFRKLRHQFQEVLGNRRIEELSVPLAIVAADIRNHHQVVFRHGLLWPALLASIAIPGAFPPQAIGGHLLVDGGVMNPVPSNVVADMGADIVIGVKLAMHHLGASLETEAVEAMGTPPWIFHTVMRSWDILQTRVMAASAEAATIQIDLNFSHEEDPGLRHWSEGRRFITMGQLGAREALPRIAGALPWMQRPSSSNATVSEDHSFASGESKGGHEDV